MKPWKAVLIIIGLAVVALLAAVLLGRVGVAKKEGTPSPSQPKLEVSSSSSQKVIESSSVEPSSTEVKVSSTSVEKEDSFVISGEDAKLERVGNASVEKSGAGIAVVKDKVIYRSGSTYIFTLKLELSVEGKPTTVDYFTSSANYSQVSIGDDLKVTYGVSSDGYIALSSVDTVK